MKRLFGLLVLLFLAKDAAAIVPPPVCYAPGACLDGYHNAINLQFFFSSTLVGPAFYNGPPPVGYSPPIHHNIYIAFGDDSVTPFTTTQLQIIDEFFSHLGTSTWVQQLLDEYPQSNDMGTGISSGDTMTLTNCLSGAPAHCWHFTYHAGDFISDQCPTLANAHGIVDTYGICITLYSLPNTNGTSFNSCPTVGSWSGVSVFAGQTLHFPAVDDCFGKSFGDQTTVIATVGSFTQPAPGTYANVMMSTTFPNHFLYVPGFGFYNVNPLDDCTFSTFCQITPNTHPINASIGTAVSGNILNGNGVVFSPNWQNSAGFCYFDAGLQLALAELSSAIINASGPDCSGWPGPYTLHDICGSGSTESPHDGSFISPASSFILTNFGFTDSTFVPSQRYDYLLPSIRHVSQSNYCSTYTVPSYSAKLCRSNSDCPTVSGICSGTKFGSTCVTPTCSDGVQNGNESDIDCGGGAASNAPFSNNCGPCFAGKKCGGNCDCAGENGVTELCVAGICITP